MAAATEATPVPEDPSKYAVLETTYELSKTGWMKLRTYPVLEKAMPLVEATTVFALGKAGLPQALPELEATYITPALSTLDAKIDPVAAKSVKLATPYVETAKTQLAAAQDALGSRDPEHLKETVVEAYATTKAKVVDVVATAKAVVVDKYDLTKDHVVSAKDHVVAAYETTKATVATTLGSSKDEDEAAE